MADTVNHPPHYNAHPSGVECIQITEHMGFCLGNAIKYIWRADMKGSALEDLEKARWYLDREIAKRRVAYVCDGKRDQYPGITMAVLAIAFDNGGIHRFRSEEQFRAELNAFLASQTIALGPIDRWLANLPQDDLQTVCTGDRDEAKAILATAPPGTDGFLTRFHGGSF